ncbi:hypothetical protein BC830DRAFT_1151561 [Chytriomyces sp. MP71]|nr:hypothetical protein BC830DRAFT_1151561 [Chytriomyces sp. MP71]
MDAVKASPPPLPCELLQAIFSWIHPCKVQAYRLVSRHVDSALTDLSFARWNLAHNFRMPKPPPTILSKQACNLDQTTEILFHWPAHYQEAVALLRLSDLRTLDILQDQRLHGTSIPNALAACKQLKQCFLNSNGICGNLPALPTSVTEIDLAFNALSGLLPDFENFHKLVLLNLGMNRFCGPIPVALCNLPLRKLNLAGNQFDGCIPESIGGLLHLESLNLSQNRLTGCVPESLCELPWLKMLWLCDNALSGMLPQRMSVMKTLEFVYIANEGLTVPDTEEFGTFISQLTFHDFSFFSGKY